MSIAALAITGCKKDDVQPSGGNNGGINGGHIPAEASGQWLHGTFAMADYWAYDGSYLGNPFTQSVAFDFNTNGTYEMYYAGQTNNWGCITNAFSYYKGYAVFSDSMFVVYPQQGRYRGYYSCSPQYNFDRAALTSELKVDTFYYSFQTDTNNIKWMIVKFNPTDSFPSYFKATNW